MSIQERAEERHEGAEINKYKAGVPPLHDPTVSHKNKRRERNVKSKSDGRTSQKDLNCSGLHVRGAKSLAKSRRGSHTHGSKVLLVAAAIHQVGNGPGCLFLDGWLILLQHPAESKGREYGLRGQQRAKRKGQRDEK